VFSLTRQAIQLGYTPRMTIVHTSSSQVGQIYLPDVNKLLALGCIALTLGFQSTTNLAAAYGIAVTGTMVITTLLFHRVTRDLWGWPPWRTRLLTALFLLVDLSFFSANAVKFPQGGWFPIVVALLVFTVMSTWKRGRQIVQQGLREGSLAMDLFIEDIARRHLARVPGPAVFLTSDASGAPPVLLHHLKHNKVLHQRVLILSIHTQDIPLVPHSERVRIKELGEGFFVVLADYGFMETPDMPGLLEELKPMGLHLKLRNAQSATAYFGLPPNRVVELGAQIQL
jgi:KUP system potassium uptake protein